MFHVKRRSSLRAKARSQPAAREPIGEAGAICGRRCVEWVGPKLGPT